MPFTPYHLGPALLFGVILFPFVDITALLLSSVLVDVEPLYVIMFAPGLPYHGILHTYVGATGIAILNAVIVWFLRDWTRQILAIFKIDQNSSFIRIFGISLLGTYSHVLLDSFLYPEMNPFFPLMGNPFLGLVSSAVVYQFCTICLFLGLVLYSVRFLAIPAVRKFNTSET
ncbi:MAG: hypothetical protein RTU09_08545 [Candidatus Thorarchaeota archaeon]